MTKGNIITKQQKGISSALLEPCMVYLISIMKININLSQDTTVRNNKIKRPRRDFIFQYMKKT